MTEPASNPFAPPMQPGGPEPPQPVSRLGKTSARMAGALLAGSTALTIVPSLSRLADRVSVANLPASYLLAVYAPTVAVLLIDILLALPLLAGSVRFRVVTWIWAGVSVLFVPLGLLAGFWGANRKLPEQAEDIVAHVNYRDALPLLFAAALFLLVSRRPTRFRVIAGGLCGVTYLILLILGRL